MDNFFVWHTPRAAIKVRKVERKPSQGAFNSVSIWHLLVQYSPCSVDTEKSDNWFSSVMKGFFFRV